MQNYSTPEINAAALLIFFSLYFMVYLGYAFYAFRHRSLLSRNRTLKKLKKLSWEDFEKLCMELFERKGWKVQGNEKKGADGGVDIWMSKGKLIGKKSAIVQCKRYEDSLVTIKIIREMYGLMYEYDVDEAYVVTTSRFTKECSKFIEDKSIILIDGEALVKMIN